MLVGAAGTCRRPLTLLAGPPAWPTPRGLRVRRQQSNLSPHGVCGPVATLTRIACHQSSWGQRRLPELGEWWLGHNRQSHHQRYPVPSFLENFQSNVSLAVRPIVGLCFAVSWRSGLLLATLSHQPGSTQSVSETHLWQSQRRSSGGGWPAAPAGSPHGPAPSADSSCAAGHPLLVSCCQGLL